MTKDWWKSKTVWFNLLSTAAALAGLLPPKVAVIAVPVINIALRAVTNQPLNIFIQK